MSTRRRAELVIAAVMCGVAVASGATATASEAPASHSASNAVTQQAVPSQGSADEAKGANTARAAAHRQWGPSWISGSYLNSHGKKWVSQPYRSKGKWAGAFVRCYNNRAKMRVRILNIDAGRYIADKTEWCNRDASIKAWTNNFQRQDRLKIILLGNQGSYVSAYYK
ncbi:hypothetical protein P6B95_00170 [Streptomyces atratus]|uniref:hypothetical protein n=1 Tax=Streptomyces atratus TaxID=1893 RepID=UPI00166FCED9|nr:hypothetical protein [Streptomyces atratus]WPW26049.1 hypothetical protein P6B95_00170 [Streptomyces atratus]GGT73550.1 hypothetical protein GCM10010207_84050 [Streptomyces atratus]